MNTELKEVLGKVSGGQDLSFDEMQAAIHQIMTGTVSEEQIGLLLTGLATKGETVDEVAGAAAALRAHMTPIETTHSSLVDTCGTGGGGSQTFNVSTTAALVAAAAGAVVAKHGNRSITSRSGSADVLAALGVNIEATVPQVQRCLDELGICFCFAPLMHPSMRHVGAVRKKLGIRTIFNVLGPLANPAGAEHQLLGAGLPELRPLLAGAIAKLGTNRTLVVSGSDGLGDVTITGVTHVTEVTSDGIREYEWTPADFGVEVGTADSLLIETPEESAAMIRSIVAGEQGGPRDIVVLNAAAALIAAGLESEPLTAASRAATAIDEGKAKNLLHQLSELSHTPS